MRISIAGTGYVGLVTGVCLAETGHEVTCVDVDADKVALINDGQAPIYEPGLEELLRRNLGRGFRATVDLADAVTGSDVTMVAVGTPFDGKQIDLSFVQQVSAQIGRAMADKQSYHVVVVKSTVVPGTTNDVVLPILEKESGKRAGEDFGVGTNPEFLSEGTAVQDFMQPDRIVLGGIDARTHQTLAKVYAAFEGVPQLETSTQAAEMIKYTSNSLLATLISFSNEIGNLCSALSVDSAEVFRGVHLSQYLNVPQAAGGRALASIASFLEAGCGFGGSCLPKDVAALVRHGQQRGEGMPLLSSVLDINQRQPARMLQLLKKHFTSLEGVRVAVLGTAFKPETDDVRESPALSIIQRLLEERSRVRAYDPIANASTRRALPNAQVEYAATLDEAIAEVDAVLLVTRWNEFRALPAKLTSRRPQPVLIDGRRIISPTDVNTYEGIGL